MVPVRAGSLQQSAEEECKSYPSPSRRSSTIELRLDPRSTAHMSPPTSSTSAVYDHTSSPKSMRARMERTSVTLSSSVDHSPGYTTTSPRQSTARRRSAGTNVSTRHRSPRISASAPKERYMPYSATSPRSSSSLSPLSPRHSALALANFTTQDSPSSVSSEQRDIFWSATTSAEFVPYSATHSPPHTQTSPRYPSTTSAHPHFQSFERVQDCDTTSAVSSYERGDIITPENWSDHFSHHPHRPDPPQFPTTLHRNEQKHQHYQSQSQDHQHVPPSSLSPLLTRHSHQSLREISSRFEAALPSHSVLSISEDRARMSHNLKEHVIFPQDDMNTPPLSHHNQPPRFHHHSHHGHASQTQHQHQHAHQTSRLHPHSWHQEGHTSEPAHERLHSLERETPYYFHHASQFGPQPTAQVSQGQYFVPPPHSSSASPHHQYHQHHQHYQHHQQHHQQHPHHQGEQPRSRPHTRHHHAFSMGHEQMPGSEEHALAGMATVINPSMMTTKPIGTTTDQAASFKLASQTAAPVGSGTKTTRRRRRPNESYSNIIIKAIRSSPLQRLKLSDIYDYVSREIPQMNGDDKGWQNTVRHNLSHNKCFRRVVIKSGPLGSGSADEKDESKQQAPPPLLLPRPSSSSSSKDESNDQVQVLEYAKKGKGGYWVLVPEFLEEAMSSSRPKKSLTTITTTATTTETTTAPAPASMASGTAVSTAIAASSTSPSTGPRLHDQSSSTAMDIDLDVASMAIAGQQSHHGLGRRFRGAEEDSMTSSGDENELEGDQSDGQSEHSLMSLKSSSHDSLRTGSGSGSEFDELEEDEDDEEEEEGDGMSARRAMSIQDMLN